MTPSRTKTFVWPEVGPAGGPKRLWTVSLGEGYAAAAVRDGRVYVLDHVQDMPIAALRGLADEERILLADALATLSPDEIDSGR